MPNQEIINRPGMLQRNEQLAQREDTRSNQIPVLRPEILLEFIRALIKNNPNGDILYLSIMAAADKTNATEEEIELLKRAIREEINTTPSHWPKGFHAEL